MKKCVNTGRRSRAKQAVKAYRSAGESTDLLGSYTGVAQTDTPTEKTDGGKVYVRRDELVYPVQDADDL